MKVLYSILILWACVASDWLSAQTVSSSLAKTKIALGEPNTIKITISDLDGKEVVAAPKDSLLPFHFEEIRDEIDLQTDQYTRLIEFSIYEEGLFTLPPLEFKIDGISQHTIPYQVEVVNTAQTGEVPLDIMKNKEVDLDLSDYWDLYKIYILGILIVLALIFLVYVFIKYGRKRASSRQTPTNQTLKKLRALKKKNYLEQHNYRNFYIELIEITRQFLEQQYHIPAEVLLTDDLLNLIKNNNKISTENERVVAQVFLRGDLVKFAKTIPNEELAVQDYQSIYDFVQRSYQDIEFENLRKDV